MRRHGRQQAVDAFPPSRSSLGEANDNWPESEHSGWAVASSEGSASETSRGRISEGTRFRLNASGRLTEVSHYDRGPLATPISPHRLDALARRDRKL